ncbi:roadblock/LC7 domain-containing protein [Candidatus Micrarchaeota archaeon]|nr:roadblock/LC7 domain-containing protein [Candidatus Micrarchaeota archaeon]
MAVDESVLEGFLKEIAESVDVEACVVALKNGTVAASSFSSSIDAQLAAATSSEIIRAAEACSGELKKGALQQVVVESGLGKIIAVPAGKNALIACVVKPSGNVGLALVAMNKAAKKISEKM